MVLTGSPGSNPIPIPAFPLKGKGKSMRRGSG
jgi:hypothetical protein